jgi:hypothetical protein
MLSQISRIQIPVNTLPSYIIDDNLCYFTICDEKFPQHIAFAFLSDLKDLFKEKLKAEYGTQSVDYRSKIETIDKKHHFIKFGQKLTQTRTYVNLKTSSMTAGSTRTLKA